MLGAVSGAIAGLVAITPACGFVTPPAALLLVLLVEQFVSGAYFHLNLNLVMMMLLMHLDYTVLVEHGGVLRQVYLQPHQ